MDTDAPQLKDIETIEAIQGARWGRGGKTKMNKQATPPAARQRGSLEVDMTYNKGVHGTWPVCTVAGEPPGAQGPVCVTVGSASAMRGPYPGALQDA